MLFYPFDQIFKYNGINYFQHSWYSWRNYFKLPYKHSCDMKTDVEEKNIVVKMSLRPSTIKRIEVLRRNSGNDNRSQLVSNAIEITEALSAYIHSGAKIYIEKKDGTKELLNIEGI